MNFKINKILPGLFVLIAIGFLFQNCGRSESSPLQSGGSVIRDELDLSLLKPDCYVSQSSPVIELNSFLSNIIWNDPHVIQYRTGYAMYASGGPLNTTDVQIYRFTSPDAISWGLTPTTSVLKKSTVGGAWDFAGVETPSVVLFNNKYYMFYTGYTDQSDVKTYKIGYATSTDGITWTKAANYLLAPTAPNSGSANLDFNQYIVAEPGAVVFNNKIYLYFVGYGYHSSAGNLMKTIGLTTSSDGLNWSTPQMVITPDQSIYPRNQNWIGYSTPQPIVINNQMHMYVDVVKDDSGWKQTRIHHLASDNGMSGWTYDSTEIFSTSSFSWTAYEIRSPSPYLLGTDLYLWYAGHNTPSPATSGFRIGIGLAKCDLKKR